MLIYADVLIPVELDDDFDEADIRDAVAEIMPKGVDYEVVGFGVPDMEEDDLN